VPAAQSPRDCRGKARPCCGKTSTISNQFVNLLAKAGLPPAGRCNSPDEYRLPCVMQTRNRGEKPTRDTEDGILENQQSGKTTPQPAVELAVHFANGKSAENSSAVQPTPKLFSAAKDLSWSRLASQQSRWESPCLKKSLAPQNHSPSFCPQ
jgi:hypothetical protein